MTDTDRSEAEPPPEGAIQDFVLLRELAEVYLLLDNISTALNKRLPDTIVDPLFPKGEMWLQDVCEIAWPPEPGLQQSDAINAAKLLRVKDELNRRAFPATGASIAFTAMMISDGRDGLSKPSKLSRFGAWVDRNSASDADNPEPGPQIPQPRRGLTGSAAGVPPTRSSLAEHAYPGMARHRGTYRRSMQLLWVFLVIWLFLTCWLSWDVAIGSSLLNRVNAIEVAKSAAAPTVDASPITRSGANGQRDRREPPPPAQFDSRLETSRLSASENLATWLDSKGWLRFGLRWTMGSHDIDDRAGPSSPPPQRRTVNTEWASVFIGVLAGTILPIFYGILGAAAAVVRGVSTRMKESTLVPRDIWLAWTQLGLGALIGACVGLFISPDGNAADRNGLISSVSLSPSALSFIAGFGVEGVFQALESLVKRVFNLETPKPPAIDGNAA